jgi:hypothetical protein
VFRFPLLDLIATFPIQARSRLFQPSFAAIVIESVCLDPLSLKTPGLVLSQQPASFVISLQTFSSGQTPQLSCATKATLPTCLDSTVNAALIVERHSSNLQLGLLVMLKFRP